MTTKGRVGARGQPLLAGTASRLSLLLREGLLEEATFQQGFQDPELPQPGQASFADLHILAHGTSADTSTLTPDIPAPPPHTLPTLVGWPLWPPREAT